MWPKWRIALVVSVAAAKTLALTAVLLIALHTIYYSEEGFGSFTSFDRHPVMMVVSMVFVYGDAILVFRIFQNPSRKMLLKCIHAVLNFSALATCCIGLVPVFLSEHKLYSLHSWLGLSAVILFALQWILGFSAFLAPGCSLIARLRYLPVHRYVGFAVLALATAAVCTGISGLSGDVKHYELHAIEGVIVNGIAVASVLHCGLVIAISRSEYFKRPLTGEEVAFTHVT